MARAGHLAILVLTVGAQLGCASSRVVQPGLANAPALPLSETIESHDVIANGHDSCPRARVAAGDPLRYRYPACAGQEIAPPGVTLLVAPVVPPEPTDELWNLHLRGLPPCPAWRAGHADEGALAMCAAE